MFFEYRKGWVHFRLWINLSLTRLNKAGESQASTKESPKYKVDHTDDQPVDHGSVLHGFMETEIQ